MTAFFVCQTGLQAGSRCIFAFARDRMLPFPFSHSSLDLSRINGYTKTPIRAIWFVALGSVLPGLLLFARYVQFPMARWMTVCVVFLKLMDLRSEEAVNAIFAMTAMAYDLSYIVPIVLSVSFINHASYPYRILTRYPIVDASSLTILKSNSSLARST